MQLGWSIRRAAQNLFHTSLGLVNEVRI